MKRIALSLFTSIVYLVLLINPATAGNSSNASTETYNQRFETNSVRYALKVRHSESGDLLIFSNDTDISFHLFSDIQSTSQLINQREGVSIECNPKSIGGSTFILSTKLRDFEETLSLACGDSVVIRERG